MAVNTLNFNQCATLLTAINKQATGQSALTPTNSAEFVSVAQTTLLSGYDTVINSISQVLSKTVFSIRPYTRKFKGLHMDNMQFGNHVRKLQIADKAPAEDSRVKLVDGESVDQQKVNKPVVLQTNFYGANVYERSVTLFKDQLDVAFSSPEEFGRFVSMVLQNVSDLIEQDHESCARMTVANFIGGKIASNSNIVHLVTEYNAEAGVELTSATVKKPENFVPFMKWAMARIKTISDLMTERTTYFHTNVEGKPISRHTPKDMQKLYLYAGDINNMESSVLSSVFHDSYLKQVDFETVNFWQSVQAPTAISVKPVYLKADGTLENAADNVVNNNVLGVLFDTEAMGITTVNAWSAAAPFNAKGGYTNTYWHFTDRYYNDFTENGVVFLMD